MLIYKQTTGFVTQVFDTDKGEYISQEFTAGQVDYEDSVGDPIDQSDHMPSPEPYLPFEMVQPSEMTELHPGVLIRKSHLERSGGLLTFTGDVAIEGNTDDLNLEALKAFLECAVTLEMDIETWDPEFQQGITCTGLGIDWETLNGN